MKNHMQHYALVTGASSGIGVEFAWQLAAKGYSLILVARREERLLSLKKVIQEKHNVAVEVVAMDLSVFNSAKILFEKIESAGWNVDVLINNAGFGVKDEFLNTEISRNQSLILLNMQTLTELTQRFAQKMCERKKGFVLQVASVAAFQAVPYMAVYSATKSYVLSLGLALYEEFKPHNVVVSTLCPGMTNTEFFEVAGQKVSDKLKNHLGMSASTVARVGLKALFNKKPFVVTGFLNKFNAFFMRRFPQTLATKIAKRIVEKTM